MEEKVSRSKVLKGKTIMDFIKTICSEMNNEGNFSFLILLVGVAQLIVMLRKK